MLDPEHGSNELPTFQSMGTGMVLTPEQRRIVDALCQELAPEQMIWLSGYLAGAAGWAHRGQQAAVSSPAPSASQAAMPVVTVLVASETGKSLLVAQRIVQRLEEAGMTVQLHDLLEYNPADLRKAALAVFCVSTHGEGDPPLPAMELHAYLQAAKAPRLEKLQFAVFGLGDRSYPKYCQFARDLDERLEALGARPLLQRTECDGDHEQQADTFAQALGAKLLAQGQAPRLEVVPGRAVARNTPTEAVLAERILLSGKGATKSVYHLELQLEQGASYQPGDTLHIQPRNDPATVEALLEALGCSGSGQVQVDDATMPLEQALLERREITTVSEAVAAAYGQMAGATTLTQRLEHETMPLEQWDLLEMVRLFPPQHLTPQALVDLLRPLAPRAYSICSSPSAHEGEVHLLVEQAYTLPGRVGAASGFLATEPVETTLSGLSWHENPYFHLPQDPALPVLMIATGTGLAPFRAFMAEARETGRRGFHWLVFGERHFRTDFYYQREWQRLLREKVLSRMDVAFSRDGFGRIHVQDRLKEQADLVYRQLQEGAHIYVCGGEAMEREVRKALLDIVQSQGGLDEGQAQETWKQIEKSRRYHRDVYGG